MEERSGRVTVPGGAAEGAHRSGDDDADAAPRPEATGAAPRAASPRAEAPAPPGLIAAARRWERTYRLDVVWVAGLALVGAALVALHVRAEPILSVFDEAQHVDYVVSVLDGDLVLRGDVLGPEAVQADACRGSRSTQPLPTCGRPLDADDYRDERGEPLQYAFVHPPTYYALTGVVARAVQAVTGADDLVTAARLVGAVWLFAGVAATWAVGRMLGAARLPLAAVLVALMSTPAVLHAASSVNPDASALLAGALVFAAALRWERTRRGLGWLVAAGVAAGALKSTHAFAPLAAGMYLLWCGFAEGAGPRTWWRAYDRSCLTAAVLLVGSCVAAVTLWVGFVEATATIASEDLPPQISDIADPTIDEHIHNALTLVSPIRGPYLPTQLESPPTVFLVRVLDHGLVAAMFGLAAIASSRRRRGFGGTLLVAAALGGLLLGLAEIALLGKFILIPPRYGLALVGGMGAALAVVCRRPIPTVGVVAFSLISAGFVVTAFAT